MILNKSTISLILFDWDKDERFYNDTEFPVHPKEKGETARERIARTNVAALRASGSTVAKSVAATLLTCRPGSRCRDGACRMCLTAQQRAFALGVGQAMSGMTVAMITIVPSDPGLQFDDLSDFHAETFRRHLENAFHDAGLSDLTVMGGIDLTHCVYNGAISESYWGPHLHCFVEGRFAGEVCRRLRTVFRNSDVIKPAVMNRMITRTPGYAFYYGYKTVFDHRSQLVSPDGRRAEPVVAKIDSNHPLFVSLMCNLSRIGLSNRIFYQVGGR